MSKISKGKFEFKGSWGIFFLYSILWFVVTGITMGLALPIWIWWTIKWSIENIELTITDA